MVHLLTHRVDMTPVSLRALRTSMRSTAMAVSMTVAMGRAVLCYTHSIRGRALMRQTTGTTAASRVLLIPALHHHLLGRQRAGYLVMTGL